MQSFRYAEPATISDALAILEKYGTAAVILAGGTDLVNHIHIGKRTPQLVVQIRKVEEFSADIVQKDKGIEIGALTTLSDIAESPIIKARYSALADAAVNIGSRQIRNRGTLIGNVCNASPAADTVPALLVYDAVVHIAGVNGMKRTVPIENFIEGPGKTILSSAEMVESIFIPYPPEASSSTYLKLSRRDGVDLAIVGVAVYATDKHIVKIALGAVGPKAYRAYNAETWLQNNGRDTASMERAAIEAAKGASPITDLRASREYRLAMIEVLARDALSKVFDKIANGRE